MVTMRFAAADDADSCLIVMLKPVRLSSFNRLPSASAVMPVMAKSAVGPLILLNTLFPGITTLLLSPLASVSVVRINDKIPTLSGNGGAAHITLSVPIHARTLPETVPCGKYWMLDIYAALLR